MILSKSHFTLHLSFDMSKPYSIQVEQLSKHYKIYERPQDRLRQLFAGTRKQYFTPFSALKNISFSVHKGETIGIIGRNGSGKSTLLQLICGTLTPSEGKITTHGRIAALLELGSGFNPEFTGKENVYLNAALLGLKPVEIDERYEAICAFADIGAFINQPIKTYSSGMMLRLAFAVIAHVDADILIVDEALAVGDAFFTQKCMRFLREFMVRGTVLFVSHDTNSVMSLCQRVIWLEKGGIKAQGEPKEICEQYLEAFYESQQGGSQVHDFKQQKLVAKEEQCFQDQRLKFINRSELRNDVEIFQFNPSSAAFGKGGAQIMQVHLLDQYAQPLAWVVGGEKVTVRILVKAFTFLNAPIIGFLIKDKLGQSLFGDNTYLTYQASPVSLKEKELLCAEFTFFMPLLAPGDYCMTVAVANGTQHEHEQHHWIHDALIFKSHVSSVSTGIIGIPMQQITLSKKKERHASAQLA